MHLLGRHVVGRPDHEARARAAFLAALDLRDPEVEHLHAIAVAGAIDEEDVLRLEIAVDDAAGVRGAQRRRDLHADHGRAPDLERAARELVGDSRALEVLEDEEGTTVHDAHVERLDDVRVTHRAGDLTLVEEAAHGSRSAAARREHLERHQPLDQGVLRDVDARLGAFTELSDHTVTFRHQCPNQRVVPGVHASGKSLFAEVTERARIHA